MTLVQTDRQVRILSTNGTDSNIAFVLNQDNDDDQNQKTYYENHKPAMLEYSHNYYAQNRESILEKKKIDNQKKEIKDRKREYMKGYYRNHKEEFREYRRKSNENKKLKLKLKLQIDASDK